MNFITAVNLPALNCIVKGRYSWDMEAKQSTISYRPFYSQWIALLHLVNPLIYVPPPKLVLPKKISAQYEIPLPSKPLSYTENYGKVRYDHHF